jgi:transposase
VPRLAGNVRRLGLDPLDGHIYLFLSRSRNILRAVTLDGSGWWVLSKRLQRGSVGLPAQPTDTQQIGLDPNVLAALLRG